MKQRYSIGSRVFHTGSGKWGEVCEAWRDGEGWRYSVWHSGFMWSVPDWALTTRTKVVTA